MKHAMLLLLYVALFSVSYGQDFLFVKDIAAGKLAIDTSVLNKWPSVEKPVMSSNGRFAAFLIDQKAMRRTTLVVKETEGVWEKAISGSGPFYPCLFTTDNKQLVYRMGDELNFLPVGSDEAVKTETIASCKWPVDAAGTWLAYQSRNPVQGLVLQNLVTGAKMNFYAAIAYDFHQKGNSFIVHRKEKVKDRFKISLLNIDLLTGKTTEVWTRESSADNLQVSRIVFDDEGNQIVFAVGKSGGSNDKENSIWYYRKGMNGAEIKVNSLSAGVPSGYSVVGQPKFSKSGKYLFFSLQPPILEQQRMKGIPDVTVWSYKDLVIQPEQLRSLGGFQGILGIDDGPLKYTAIINVSDSVVVTLEKEDERVLTAPKDVFGDYVVLMDNKSVGLQDWFKFVLQPSFYLVSLKDASRKLIKKNISQKLINNFSYSPNGKYIVFWDCSDANYISCDVSSGDLLNITKGVPLGVTKEPEFTYNLNLQPAAPVAGWSRNDSSLLIYDNFDIWEVSPRNSFAPKNITTGYGKANGVKLQLVYGPGESVEDKSSIVYAKGDTLLLTGFKLSDKKNGFFRMVIGKSEMPDLLTMGDFCYYLTHWQKPHFYTIGPDMQPVKAANSNSWIVKRQSAIQAPNFYFTKDFKSYKPLSDIQPQKEYNWLTAELIKWKLPKGKVAHGILYKPENFDASKKYPVIISFYKQMSHMLNEFPYPSYFSANINIPWFVSNGYLVFRPDIHYSMTGTTTRKLVGESALEALSSAVIHLNKYSYIDKEKIALQGHSVGGGEVNYVISHSNLFTAAVEFAGVSDPVSQFLTLTPLMADIEHSDRLSRLETMAGVTPWENPGLYVKGSAVMNADKITTPLLIIHNEKDNQIPWRQGIELYMALRRLGKPVWMLQYTNGAHSVSGIDVVDYSIRVTQFFNFYLKDCRPPRWMTEGIPATLKGIEMRYELDAANKKP